MNISSFKQARIKGSAGFSLLELLVVLFLLSIGYATLYSAGIGGDDQSDAFETTKSEVRESIRYAKRLALAKGQVVAVSVLADELQLFDSTGTNPLNSPVTQQDYVVSSDFKLNAFVTDETSLLLADGTGVSQLFFDALGRISSKAASADPLSPLQNSVSITIEDSSGTTEQLLSINNITGELM